MLRLALGVTIIVPMPVGTVRMESKSTDTLEPLVVRRSRLRAFVTAVVAAVLAVAAVWFAFNAETGLERLFAVSMAIFFGFAAALAALSGFERTPVIEVDEEGIVDRGSPVRVGRLRWEEVKRVEAKVVGRQPILAILVYRPQRFVVDLPPDRREVAEEAIQRHGTPIVIPWSGFDRRIEDVVERAEAFRRVYQERRK
ncbi:hypothetical protein HRbin28_02603 [bacterium HR28]|nr:hypothetical protein HRbin28_02603 [bacterium HR28]